MRDMCCITFLYFTLCFLPLLAVGYSKVVPNRKQQNSEKTEALGNL